MNWQLKALLPVVLVLVAGLLLFTVATVSLQDPDRHSLSLACGGGCGGHLRSFDWGTGLPGAAADGGVAGEGGADQRGQSRSEVSFSRRNDEIGDLGRNFNHMAQQLRESRREIETMHRTQMSRAEHLATLGELAAGLAHEIRNPLAGIAGVIEIVGRDLPPTSPAREMVKDLKQEINRINRILTGPAGGGAAAPAEQTCAEPEHDGGSRGDAGAATGAVKANRIRLEKDARFWPRWNTTATRSTRWC